MQVVTEILKSNSCYGRKIQTIITCMTNGIWSYLSVRFVTHQHFGIKIKRETSAEMVDCTIVNY